MEALICARLVSFVLHALKPTYPALRVKLWSDSEIVLHSPHSNEPLILFMTNRTEEIKTLFPTSDWNHCPTSVNPADLFTRGINAEQLHESSLWKCGPQCGYNLSHIGLLGLPHKPFTVNSNSCCWNCQGRAYPNRTRGEARHSSCHRCTSLQHVSKTLRYCCLCPAICTKPSEAHTIRQRTIVCQGTPRRTSHLDQGLSSSHLS